MKLPHNWETERAVLGALLLDGTQIRAVADIVPPEDFAHPHNAEVMRRLVELDARGIGASLTTLLDILAGEGSMDSVGGAAYLLALPQACATVDHVLDHARRVRRHADHRRAMLALQASMEEAAHLEGEADAVGRLVDGAIERLREVQAGAATTLPYKIPGDVVDELLQAAEEAARHPGQVRGLTTGLADLDRLIGGLQKGRVHILAARPGMGKSALAEGFALHQARKGVPVAYFSLEMPARSLVHRAGCMVGKVNGAKVENGTANQDEIGRYAGALNDIAEWPLLIDDTAGLRIDELRARARKMVATKGVQLVIVDYVQLVRGLSRKDGREREVADISAGLVALAHDLDVPVVALAQLNRGLESRADKRPMQSDLRESGSLEQDADHVLFIYRDEVYNPDTPDKGLAEIIVAKNRGGQTGRVKAAFLGEFTLFQGYVEQGGW